MNDNTTRYSGPATVIQSYMKEFLVECPKCSRLAIITSSERYDRSTDKLACTNCKHIEKLDDHIRYNAIIKRACDSCGKFIDTTVPNNKEKVEQLTIPCPCCGTVRTYKPRNESYRLVYKSLGASDPIFNLPLWLQTHVKGEILWAYNRIHLADIRNYVSAKLRERQTLAYTTMVEKLPNFIKIAKNRATITKAIDRLTKK